MFQQSGISELGCEFGAKVASALENNPYIRHHQVHFEAREGHVRLSGRVRSYFQKQMAQEMLRAVEGIRSIENEIEVSWQRAECAAAVA